MIPSMSRKGDCWDNSPTERFFRSLKSERLSDYAFATRKAAQMQVLDYIGYYNGIRFSLGRRFGCWQGWFLKMGLLRIPGIHKFKLRSRETRDRTGNRNSRHRGYRQQGQALGGYPGRFYQSLILPITDTKRWKPGNGCVFIAEQRLAWPLYESRKLLPLWEELGLRISVLVF